MPMDNQTAALDLQAEPFVTNNVIVAPGVNSGVASVVPPDVQNTRVETPGGSSAPEEEQTLWEGRYSTRNFFGRGIGGVMLAAAWLVLAAATWGFGYPDLAWLTYFVGFAILVYWLALAWKVFRVQRNHYYQLTSRRLLLTTGIFQRRVDQIELIRIKDLFVRQSLISSWLDVGTVILISSEQTLPKAHLLGVEQPHHVRDLIWRNSRVERDERTSEVNPV